MTDILAKYASNLNIFKLSEFLINENDLILKMNYSMDINWNPLKTVLVFGLYKLRYPPSEGGMLFT
jgi:hypothetical protein